MRALAPLLAAIFLVFPGVSVAFRGAQLRPSQNIINVSNDGHVEKTAAHMDENRQVLIRLKNFIAKGGDAKRCPVINNHLGAFKVVGEGFEKAKPAQEIVGQSPIQDANMFSLTRQCKNGKADIGKGSFQCMRSILVDRERVLQEKQEDLRKGYAAYCESENHRSSWAEARYLEIKKDIDDLNQRSVFSGDRLLWSVGQCKEPTEMALGALGSVCSDYSKIREYLQERLDQVRKQKETVQQREAAEGSQN